MLNDLSTSSEEPPYARTKKNIKLSNNAECPFLYPTFLQKTIPSFYVAV